MKKIFLVIICLVMVSAPVFAADVVIELTIPSAYVARLADAVNNGLNCTVVDAEGNVTEVLDAKACLTRRLMHQLKDFLNKYEEAKAKQDAQDAYNAVYQTWLDNYVEVPVE